MDVLRTPDARFENLPGYDFEPHYVDVASGDARVRMHHVDEGTGPVVLMLHGEPSWSYLYRKMIPPLVSTGHRVVAPDLIGFGRSDKPASRHDYTYQRHVDWMWSFVESLDLDDITLFCQNWGGLIGLRLVGEHPERFAGVMASNTFLPTGDQDLGEAFFTWRKFSQEVDEFPVGQFVALGCTTEPSPEVLAAYDAPFPDESYKEGARQFPTLVPATPEDPATPANRAAWVGLSAFDKPFLTAFGDSDPITKGADVVLQATIPGAAGQRHTTVEGGGHFIQEDRGAELAELLAEFVARRAG